MIKNFKGLKQRCQRQFLALPRLDDSSISVFPTYLSVRKYYVNVEMDSYIFVSSVLGIHNYCVTMEIVSFFLSFHSMSMYVNTLLIEMYSSISVSPTYVSVCKYYVNVEMDSYIFVFSVLGTHNYRVTLKRIVTFFGLSILCLCILIPYYYRNVQFYFCLSYLLVCT